MKRRKEVKREEKGYGARYEEKEGERCRERE